MAHKHPKQGQMSESFYTVIFLSLSGGLQDAYTYLFRGGVFANAQTGNIVLLSVHLFEGDLHSAGRYLIPLLAFSLGVLASELIRWHFRGRMLHWRQLVVLGEIALLFLVGFLPSQLDLLANALVSFACAMQVQAFRKVDGYPFASTMCIGNLRSGVESLCAWERTGNRESRRKTGYYFSVILLFALGAGLGSLSLGWWGARAIWLSCALLAASFLLMFIREELEEDPIIQKELSEIRRDSAAIRQELAKELRQELSEKDE